MMITSRSFDYDDILSRHACVIITNANLSPCSLARTRSLEKFSFFLSVHHVQVNKSIDRFFSLSSSISSISPFQFPDMSSRVDCLIYLINNLLCSSSWQMTRRQKGADEKKTAAVPLRWSFSCFFLFLLTHERKISTKQCYAIIDDEWIKKNIYMIPVDIILLELIDFLLHAAMIKTSKEKHRQSNRIFSS